MEAQPAAYKFTTLQMDYQSHLMMKLIVITEVTTQCLRTLPNVTVTRAVAEMELEQFAAQ